MNGLSPVVISLLVHGALAWAALNTSQHFDFFKPEEKKKQIYTLDFVPLKKPKPLVLKPKPIKNKATKKKRKVLAKPKPKPKKSYKKKPQLVTQKQKSPVKIVQGSAGRTGARKTRAPIPPYKGPKIMSRESIQQQGGNRPPQYPIVDRIRKNTGTVTVIGYVNKKGRVSDVKVDSSTGTRRMNVSSMAAFKNYRFQKGQQGWVKMPFKYTLDDGEARVLSVRDRHVIEKLKQVK
ncbi:MAG: TonB family protein [Pseudomonadota bacterium]